MTSPVNPTVPSAVPVPATERLILLDSLWGIAVQGILVMNIPDSPCLFAEVMDPLVELQQRSQGVVEGRPRNVYRKSKYKLDDSEKRKRLSD